MADPDPRRPAEFPDISSKLSAPKKLSAYEKDKQAAEAKRQRAKAENEAALKAFQDDFDNGDDDYSPSSRGPPAGPRGYNANYGSAGPPGPPGRLGGLSRSGPGSLGPAPGPPPPSLKRKRALDEMRESRQMQHEEEDDFMGQRAGIDFGRTETNEDHYVEQEEEIESRPAVQLANLPLGITENDVKDILKGRLDVHSVEILPYHVPGPSGKKSKIAIARLSPATTNAEIDAVSATLESHYLSCGYILSIKRHLESTLELSTAQTGLSRAPIEPFGAQKLEREKNERTNMRHAPPPGSFAPPTSLGGYDHMDDTNDLDEDIPRAIVDVQPPEDINTLRAIHAVADRLLSEPNPDRALEIEAMLMALPEVEEDARFSFLYDSSTVAGAYYRYLLWSEPPNGPLRDFRPKPQKRLFEDEVVDWKEPLPQLPYFDLTELASAREHNDYNSDNDSTAGYDDPDLDEENDTQDPAKRKVASPLWKAKFAWILATAPRSTSRLTKMDVSATTHYAVMNADTAADDIVNMMVLNLQKPFAYTHCANQVQPHSNDDEDSAYNPEDGVPYTTPDLDNDKATDATRKASGDDVSQMKLVALYLISDVLGASKTAGLKGAWKYKQLFENAFTASKTFEHLGQLDKDLGWGRMKQDKWKRAVMVVLDCWESWDIFTRAALDSFKEKFLGRKELKAEDGEVPKDEDTDARSKQPAWLRNSGKGVSEGDEDEDMEDVHDGTPLAGSDELVPEDKENDNGSEDPKNDSTRKNESGDAAVGLDQGAKVGSDWEAKVEALQEQQDGRIPEAMGQQEQKGKQTDDMFADSDDE